MKTALLLCGKSLKPSAALYGCLLAMCAAAVAGPYPADVAGWDEAARETQLQAGTALLADLAAAVERGDRRYDVKPGVYRFDEFSGSARGKGWYLRLFEVSDFVLDGHGSTFYFSRPGHALSLYKCTNVTVRNMVFDWDPLPYCQGVVTALDGDRMTVRLDPGYAVPANVTVKKGPRAMLFDAEGNLKANQSGFVLSDREDLGERLHRFRVWGFYNIPPAQCGIAVGDPIALWTRWGRAVTVEVAENITLEDITLYAAGFVGFVGHAGRGPVRFRRCRIVRRPGTDRLVGGNADGINVSRMTHGPIIEDCVMENLGDDFVNIHGAYYRVFAQESPTQLVTQRFPVGDRPGPGLRFLSPGPDHRFLGKAEVVNAESITYTVPEDWKPTKWMANLNFTAGQTVQAIRLTLDKPVDTTETGAIFDSPGAVCAGSVVRGCTFVGSLARGIRLQSTDAVIEDNTLRRTMSPAMTFSGHPGFWGEATNSRNVVVRGNRFVESSYGDPRWGRAAIAIYTDGNNETADLVRDILIQNNTIVRPGGTGIYLNGCRNVRIRDSTVESWGMLDPNPYPQNIPELPQYGLPITDLWSRDTVLNGNRFVQPGPHAQTPAQDE